MAIGDLIGLFDGALYADVERLQKTAVGARTVAIMAHWPVQYASLSKEEALKSNYPTAESMVLGPIWGGVLLRAGDTIRHCYNATGRDMVLADKPWNVIGVNVREGYGDLEVQVAYLIERT